VTITTAIIVMVPSPPSLLALLPGGAHIDAWGCGNIGVFTW